MILLLAAVLTLFPSPQAEGWYTLLQGSYQQNCSADYLLSEDTDRGLLVNELPFVAVGNIPYLPWSNAYIVDPLQSGVWGGGRWNTFVDKRPLQDSLSISRIGLIQNSMDRGRYLFQLDRPLPWKSSGNFQMLRDDSLRLFSGTINKGHFSTRTMSWEGDRYGWGSWTGWSSSNFYARTGFARLTHGDRRPEILAGASGSIRTVTVQVGAAASYTDSSFTGRGVTGISTMMGPLKVSGYCEYNNIGESYWGGFSIPAGRVHISSVVSRPADGKLFQVVALRHSDFNLIGRFLNSTAVAADVKMAKGFLRGKGAASWDFDSDSLSVSAWMLLGIDWYAGRFEFGPRISAGLDSVEKWDEMVDALFGFTLASFSLAGAVEDVTDDLGRSWSFGITWAFTDQPPRPPEDETER